MNTLANATLNNTQNRRICSDFLDYNPSFTTSVWVSYIVTSILDCVFAVFSLLGNGTVLVSLWRTESLHSPANGFLCCLVLSDFLTGLLLQPLGTAFKAAQFLGNSRVACLLRLIFNRLMWLLSPVTFFSLVGISVEKYLALQLHLRYKTLITQERVIVSILLMWLLSLVVTIVEPLGLPKNVFNRIIMSLTGLGLLITAICYVKIFQIIQRHRKQIKSQQQNETAAERGVDMAKLRKSSITMFYIVGIFILCYLPFLTSMVVQSSRGFTVEVKVAQICCATLIFMNSSFNVVIYCYRIGDIRKAMIKTLRSFLCLRRKRSNISLSYGRESNAVTYK